MIWERRRSGSELFYSDTHTSTCTLRASYVPSFLPKEKSAAVSPVCPIGYYMPTHKPRINCSPLRSPFAPQAFQQTFISELVIRIQFISLRSTVHRLHARYLKDLSNADKRSRTSLRSCLSRSTRHR